MDVLNKLEKAQDIIGEVLDFLEWKDPEDMSKFTDEELIEELEGRDYELNIKETLTDIEEVMERYK